MKVKTNNIVPLLRGLCLLTLVLLPCASQAADLTLAQAQAGAAKGDAEAEFVLGKAFYTGNGVPQDYAKAFDLYQKSANQGFAKAQNNLASMYGKGEGVKADPKAAAEWYRKAAEQGSVYAQINLAEVLKAGAGVPKDYKEAAEWYQKAADQGTFEAYTLLGKLYDHGGPGVHRDAQKAFIYYQKAADQGDTDAQVELGRHYFTGLGTKQDKITGYKWVLISANQGNDDAKELQLELQPQISPNDIVKASELAADYKAPKPNLPAKAQD